MPTISSVDGTVIAYERTGRGPALILVDGAMCYRGAGPMRPLAEALADQFTVYTYDRRGRGESSDTEPYTVDREVEDLRALIDVAGGEAYVYGISSGAALALRTAAGGAGITRLALYEPPFLAEFDGGTRAKDYTEGLRECLDAGRRGDAVALFMAYVGMPAEAIDGIRSTPGWAMLEAIAPTLAYDDEILAGGWVPRETAARVGVPTVLLAGGASPELLIQAAHATAQALPDGEYRVLEGQTHDVQPEALAPALIEFFSQAQSRN